MDARVPATIALHLAKADLKVAELERLQAETPNLRGNSDQRIRIGRRLKVARDLANSWSRVLGLVAGEKTDQMVCELKAPERVVAQSAYVPDGPNHLYCNRSVCYWFAGTGASLTPLTADDLPDGGVCRNCGTDVLI